MNNMKLFLAEVIKDKRNTQIFISASNEEAARRIVDQSLSQYDKLISLSEQVVPSMPE